MQTEVYADLYFFVNTSMDLLCLMLTSALLHRKAGRLRAIGGAVLGGGYALASLLLGLSGISGFLLNLLAEILICFVVFATRKTSFLSLMKTALVFFLVSATMGGIMTALYSWLNSLRLPLGEIGSDDISAWLFAILATVAGILTYRSGRWFGFSKKSKTVKIKVYAFDRWIELDGIVDTGNLLRDPISGRNVVIADRKKLKGFFPEPALKPPGDPTLEAWISDYRHAKILRWIPTRTATNQGLLLAIVPEKMEITDGKDTFSGNYLLAAGDVSSPGQDWNALLPAE